MRTRFYVVADKNGFIRATKRVPSIYRDEVVVAMLLEVPDSCFNPPIVTVDVEVQPDQVAKLTAAVQVVEPPEYEPEGVG